MRRRFWLRRNPQMEKWLSGLTRPDPFHPRFELEELGEDNIPVAVVFCGDAIGARRLIAELGGEELTG